MTKKEQTLTKDKFQEKMEKLTEQEAQRTGKSRTEVAREVLHNYRQPELSEQSKQNTLPQT